MSQQEETKDKEKQVAPFVEINDFNEKFDKYTSCVSIVSSGNNIIFEFDRTWMVENGATNHMIGILYSFLFISEIGIDHFMDGIHHIRGVNIVRFLLDFRGIMEVEGVLFVPRMRFSLLLVLAIKDDGYVMNFECGYAYLHAIDEVPIMTILIGEWRGRVYIVHGQPVGGQLGWISDSKGEKEV